MLYQDAVLEQPQVDFRRAWYTTAVLMVAYTFSFLDRQILNLMVGPIKHEFNLTDVQFALLTGGAFGIFYTVMGLPIGWLADRFPRKWIISGGIALWSLMTAACGLTRSYPSLFLARIGVGVGEATLSPSAHSMLSNLFDRSRLPKAMGVYSVGIYIGAGIAMILGGTTVAAITRTPVMRIPVVGFISSWHLVFMVVGLPGLLVAVWAATLVEPRRDRTLEAATPERQFSITRVGRFFASFPLMACALFLGSAVLAVMSYMDAWYPELFIRTWHWDARLTGSVNGTASLTAGPLGMLTAGWWSGRMIRRGAVDACLRLTAYAAAASAAAGILMPLMPNAVLMAGMLIPLKFLGGFAPVLIPSAIQLVAPPALRAQLSAAFMLTVGILGVTLGPLLPAFFTDYVFHDEHALRYSLSLTAAIVAPLACVLLSMGLRQYTRRLADLERARGDQPPGSLSCRP